MGLRLRSAWQSLTVCRRNLCSKACNFPGTWCIMSHGWKITVTEYRSQTQYRWWGHYYGNNYGIIAFKRYRVVFVWHVPDGGRIETDCRQQAGTNPLPADKYPAQGCAARGGRYGNYPVLLRYHGDGCRICKFWHDEGFPGDRHYYGGEHWNKHHRMDFVPFLCAGLGWDCTAFVDGYDFCNRCNHRYYL